MTAEPEIVSTMPGQPSYPGLYQINTRPWLHDLAQALGLDRQATLDDVPDGVLDAIAAQGFDWVWLLGVWQTGPVGRRISASNPEWRQGYAATLPDFRDEDISGSPFAIVSYAVHTDFGGPQALERMRARLRQRGLRLLLDFVPNHTAIDHPWVLEHPEFYIAGSADDLAQQPQNYFAIPTPQGNLVLAHGKDPYFDGWPDTVQLNYRDAGARAAQIAELLNIAAQCDAVRCDMAMLILPGVFQNTWGDRSLPADGSAPCDDLWWPEAIAAVRQQYPGFLFMAEVYWDLEWTLQQQGFDYTYDKRLYDRLAADNAPGINGHLHADAEFQRRSARFLENHDEPRAAATFPLGQHQAAAVITYLVPGLRFFHQGQLQGYQIKTSIHLGRWPAEPDNPVLADFYARLLTCLRRPEVRDGDWALLDPRQAWDGNPTWDRFIAFAWDDPASRARLLIVANYGATQGQCFVPWPWVGESAQGYRLADLLGPEIYERDGADLAAGGLYLDLPTWGYNVFEVTPI
jgi:hypothetical protein